MPGQNQKWAWLKKHVLGWGLELGWVVMSMVCDWSELELSLAVHHLVMKEGLGSGRRQQ